MSDQVHIVASDAVSYIEKLTEAFKQGYRVSADNENYPVDSHVKAVVLFKEPAQPVHKPKVGLKFKKITTMDRLEFIVQLQQAIIEGFQPDFDSVYWGVQKEVALKENKNQPKFQKNISLFKKLLQK
jgi:hypothetical protein